MIIKTNSLEIFKQNEYRQTDIGYVSNNAYLSIVATNKCQRNCFYCINSHTDKTLELPIDKAVENIQKVVNKYHIKEAVVLGGEPLMHSDIITLCQKVKECGIEKLFLTTNGILLDDEFIIAALSRYLNGINISFHNEDFISFSKLKEIYEFLHGYGVKVRINTNIWRGNHDTLQSLLDFLSLISTACDEIRVSNLIPKDSFSVNEINNDTSLILNIGDNIPTLTSKDYDKLFINCKH